MPQADNDSVVSGGEVIDTYAGHDHTYESN
jgi:hypothetical protein